MRVCLKHREPAVETLTSRKDGTEYDLCPKCAAELQSILAEVPEVKKRGPKRTA